MNCSWMAMRAGFTFSSWIVGRMFGTRMHSMPAARNFSAASRWANLLQPRMTVPSPCTLQMMSAFSSTLAMSPPSVPPESRMMSGLISRSTSSRNSGGSSAETTSMTRAPAVMATSFAAFAVTRGMYPMATMRSPPAALHELNRTISGANSTPLARISASAPRAPSLMFSSVVGCWPRARNVSFPSARAKAAPFV